MEHLVQAMALRNRVNVDYSLVLVVNNDGNRFFEDKDDHP